MDQNQDKKKVEALEKKLNLALQRLEELNKRVQYLERENSRRKSDVTQISSAIKRL